MNSTDRDKKFSQVASDIAFKHSQGVILPHGVNGLAADIDTTLAEARRETWEAAVATVNQAAHDCPVFVFHSKQGREFVIAALESAKEKDEH